VAATVASGGETSPGIGCGRGVGAASVCALADAGRGGGLTDFHLVAHHLEQRQRLGFGELRPGRRDGLWRSGVRRYSAVGHRSLCLPDRRLFDGGLLDRHPLGTGNRRNNDGSLHLFGRRPPFLKHGLGLNRIGLSR
jgi:hypothetical protein